MTAIPTIIAGRYQVLRQLGKGGMGMVYLVKHANTGELLALKVLHEQFEANPESLERFRREMKVPARIKSEHVVKITDADAAPELHGAMFYVMELLSGCDLAQLVRHRHQLAKAEVIWLLRQVAKALDKAHQSGIVHRDLKPENLFLHRSDEDTLLVKILDFGLARFTEEARVSGNDRNRLTQTQAMLGSPLYMAPEQAKAGESPEPIGPPADIWAMGMVAYELLTGKTYWVADSLVQLIGQLFFSEMPAPSQKSPSLPTGFDGWFRRSCHRVPAERWPSASQQVKELAVALGVTDSDLEHVPASLSPALAQIAQGVELTLPEGFVGSVPAGGTDSKSGLAGTPTSLLRDSLPANELVVTDETEGVQAEAETVIIHGGTPPLALAATQQQITSGTHGTTSVSAATGRTGGELRRPMIVVAALVAGFGLVLAGWLGWRSLAAPSSQSHDASPSRDLGAAMEPPDMSRPADLAVPMDVTGSRASPGPQRGQKPARPPSPESGSPSRPNGNTSPSMPKAPVSEPKGTNRPEPSKRPQKLYVPPTL